MRRLASAVFGVCLFAVLAVADQPGSVPLRVRVADGSTDRRLAGAYVALYAADDPWPRPSFETVTSDGHATFTVTPGSYQLFAGADGYQLNGRAVEVAPGEAVAAELSLLPAVLTKSGTVTDGTGKPIAGARVSQVRVPLSDRAREQLADGWTTKTDENGWWRLSVPSDANLPLFIEAAGYAPAWHVSRPAEAAVPLDVVLQKGARLLVRLDRTDAEMVVTLSTDAVQPIPSGWQKEVWQKRATARELLWEGLLPGEYRLHVVSRDASRLARTDSTFRADIAVPAEQRVVLPRLPSRRGTTLFIARTTPREIGRLEAGQRSAAGGAERLESAVETASGGTLVHIGATASVEQLFAVSPDNLIVPFAGPQPSSRTVRATIYPRGEVKLRVVPATEGLESPRHGTAVFRDCPMDRRVTLPVTIGEDGSVTLPAPVDCRTLNLVLAPLESLVMPIAVQKQESRWVGEFRLTAAGEADIRALWDPSGLVAAGVTVRATVSGDDRQLVVAEGLTDAAGRLLLTGLPADEELTLEARSERASTVGTAVLRIAPGTRGRVDPLPLPEPAKLTITPRLSKRFQDLDPKAVIAALVLETDGREEGTRTPRSDGLDERGSVVFSDIRPGRWIVRAIVTSADQSQPIDAMDVRLAAGENRTIEPVLEPLIFHGRLLVAEVLTRTSIGIADPRRWNGIRRRIRPLPDGTWSAILPRTGMYDVTVQLGDPTSGEIDVGELEFSDPGRSVDIRVPQSSLVVAVRKRGEPEPGAAVTLRLRREAPETRARDFVRSGVADTQGNVRFAHLPVGRWLASATGGNKHAAENTAVVARDTESGVQLDLQPTTHVAGVVRDATGRPAPAAAVECFFAAPTGLASQRAETDADGRFTLELVSAPALLRCTAISRDRVVGVYVVRPSATIDLTLPAVGAAIRLADWSEHVPASDLWLVAADGRVANVTAMAAKASRGGAVLIPHFPPGFWKVVRTRHADEWSMIANGMIGSSEVIAEVRLEPGRVEEITVYGERENTR